MTLDHAKDMKTSKLAQCFDVEIDPVTLDKIVDGLLAVSALSGAEIRLLLQKNEAFATLACLRNAAKVKSNAGKLLPCEDEAFAKKAILTGRMQQAPYGSRRGSELVHHLAAPIFNAGRCIAVAVADAPLLTRRIQDPTHSIKRQISGLMKVLFGEHIDPQFGIDLISKSAHVERFEKTETINIDTLIASVGWRLCRSKRNNSSMIWIETKKTPIIACVKPEYQEQRELSGYALVRSELHHRVKNNLQTIVSLLRMQARRSESDNARVALNDAAARVLSLADVHDLLSHTHVEQIELRKLAGRILDHVTERYYSNRQTMVETAVIGHEVWLNSTNASAIAPALNELFDNCFKHAFRNSQHGSISVNIIEKNEWIVLNVIDDGCGMDLSVEDVPDQDTSLGLFIVRNLVETNLQGEIDFKSQPGEGTAVRIRIPREH